MWLSYDSTGKYVRIVNIIIRCFEVYVNINSIVLSLHDPCFLCHRHLGKVGQSLPPQTRMCYLYFDVKDTYRG